MYGVLNLRFAGLSVLEAEGVMCDALILRFTAAVAMDQPNPVIGATPGTVRKERVSRLPSGP